MGEKEEPGRVPLNEEQRRLAARLDARHDEAAALRSRLDRLSADLTANDKAEREGAASDSSDGSLGGAMNLGFRVLAEFVSAVAVGALLGWQFDKWFGTSPLLILVFLLLGTAAGFWNVYRLAMKPTDRKP